ncbi:4-(cytidine 5'-diphospho)-2-C-methyl-D-erythritol kinase [Campylobacter insulaenigrae]|uniref:4-diphosphocytidyl-2-C-methyl-D-erythritol kinase n=1 Tax=Campylobacter insulaenigrae TaxID=260714 RepID=A0ABY3G3E9_9BACT|nr:4-(cytidine 5'-diphospho)-2-C-methyl-D-erythritol kinase [Campylobacter insulaenigrae]MCR6583586.1 4-(cytidine 5'-diphospho)-2-C-methyl-D-erythritol kinase [Campylobacter insulaenigrae]MCR6594540.1 4-(cytidine 5'-diphospho)-2-C-methyl-D-erythritol kinase [Campylobacter insulaenigrae]TWO24641.1 4-(cytidine 5'-diphospho)-2-C-methyl-D-erythritol kinase [Campylobacter insulaenigrae]
MKAFAKANIFLKVIGFDTRSYHLISSRFVLLKHLYDELNFSDEKNKEGFEIIGNFKEDTIIHKAYYELENLGYKEQLKEFFKNKSLKLIKNIPIGGGLGGSSTDAVAFLLMVNEELNLKLSQDTLKQICQKLGSDLLFFLSGYESANVSGCGEIIEYFEDDFTLLNFTFLDFACSSAKVYKAFDETHYDLKENLQLAKQFNQLKTQQLLDFKNIQLNDLFAPCVKIYPKMQKFLSQGYFLSGSGSSVFKA